METVAENAASEHLPLLSKETLPPEWQGEHPLLCVAGRSLIDEAAAIMLAQLATAHGLAARVEAAEALSTTNVFRLDTTGVAIVCLVSSAHALRRSALEAEVTKRNHCPGLLGQGDRPRCVGIVAGRRESRLGCVQPG